MRSKDLVTVRIAKSADNDSIDRIKSVPRHGHVITQTGSLQATGRGQTCRD